MFKVTMEITGGKQFSNVAIEISDLSELGEAVDKLKVAIMDRVEIDFKGNSLT